MKIKLGAAAALVCALIVVANTTSASRVSKQQPAKGAEKRGTIAWQVKKAKEKKAAKVELAPVEEYAAVVTDVEDALAQYTVLVARLAAKKSYVVNDDSISTWNKFKVLEVVSRPTASTACKGCLSGMSVPPDLLPLADDEILVPTSGGSVTVEGVELFSEDKFLGEHFLPSRQYLIFVALDTDSKVGKLRLGPESVFALDDDRLKPVGRRGVGNLKRDLEAQLGNSLDLLKARARKKH